MGARHYPGVSARVFLTPKQRSVISEMDLQLKSLTACVSENAPGTTPAVTAAPNNSSFLTVLSETPLTGERRLVVTSPLTGSDAGAGATYTLALSTSALVAILGGTPALTYGTTVLAGSAATFLRTDDRVKFPTALMSSANLSTLTLTDDATDQTLTGSLGALNLRTASEKLSLPKWTGGGSDTATTGTILGFQVLSSNIGTLVSSGIDASISFNDASTYTGTKLGGRFVLAATNIAGATYSALSLKALTGTISPTTHTSGTHTFTERTGLELNIGTALQSGTGAVTVTDTHGIRITGFPSIGTGGTQTNARSIRVQFPSIGATIRRGISLETITGNVGTEAANAEGFYCEDITRGTAIRRSYAAEGATTGTPTDVVLFDQVGAHAVGTNRYFARGLNASTLSNPSGIAQTVLSLSQLNTGATAGAHLNFDSKAGDPPAPVTGDVWRNGDALYFKQAAATVDLTLGGSGGGASLGLIEATAHNMNLN